MKLATKVLSVLGILLAGPSLGQAAMIGTFEGGVIEPGWEIEDDAGPNGPNSIASVNTGAPKATDGDWSLEVDASNRDAWTLLIKNFGAFPDIMAHTTLEFDIYVEALPAAGWGQAFPVLNTHQGGWAPGPNVPLSVGTNHISYDYVAGGANVGGDWGGVHIGINGGGTFGTVWIDNVQLTNPIPEPASFVLLGIGVALIAVRRRK